MSKENIRELKQPDITDLGASLIEVVYKYVDTEERKGNEVRNAFIVGHIEYVKAKFIKDSMDNI